MKHVILSVALMLAALPVRADIEIEEVTTPGGLEAWLVEDHSIPFVALEIRFRGGASLDAPDARGATNLMVGLLEEGADDMTAQEFSRARESLAAKFSYGVDDDAVSVSAQMLTENRDEAAALLRSSLVAPRFDDDAIERVRRQVLSGLRSDQTDPRAMASRVFDQLVFGEHPYGSAREGTLDSVEGLSREDIVAAHEAALTRGDIYISAVGDITADELGPLLDDLLGDLPQEGPSLPEPVEPNLPGGVQVEEFETPQSVAVFAQPGTKRDDADFFAAYVLNHILGGGGFESRLQTEVREKRGLTYGVYSYLADKDAAQIWAGSVSSANDRVAEAIRVIRDEWARIRDDGVTEEELRDAKTYLTGAYTLRFEGNRPIARIAVNMQMDGLPIDYIANRNDMVEAVTLDDINRVARERVDPEQLTFVVVGQPEGLDDSIN